MLQLVIEGQPQPVRQVVAERFAAIVVGQGEQAAQGRDAQQHQRGAVQGVPRLLRGYRRAPQQHLGAVHGIPQVLGDHELKDGRRQNRARGQDQPQPLRCRELEDPPQDRRVVTGVVVLVDGHAGIRTRVYVFPLPGLRPVAGSRFSCRRVVRCHFSGSGKKLPKSASGVRCDGGRSTYH